MKKVLEKAELPGETTVLMHSPPDTRVLECHEEFYDAIMAEEEDESEDQELVPKHPNMTASQKFRAGSWSVMLPVSARDILQAGEARSSTWGC